MTHAWKGQLDAIVAEQRERIVALRRRLHQSPEPSGAEHETSQLLYQQLLELDLDARVGPEGCGVVADNRIDSEELRVAFRGDIDALRIQDEKQVAYRSQRPGLMHACGHDAHAAIAVGTASALATLEARGQTPWPLAWRAILQPEEETATGARRLVDWGVLEQVRTVFALHVDPTRASGTIGICSGPFTASCDGLEFTITGLGGHGARPHESKDPIAATAQLINALYQFVPLATDSFDAVVLSIGRVESGQNPNVIPDRAELSGTLRTLSPAVRQRTIEKVEQIVRGVSEITETDIVMTLTASIPAVENDPNATEIVRMAAAETLGVEGIQAIHRPSMGSEDFACFLEHAPGAMFRLGTARDLSDVTPLHTPRFDIDERALEMGVQIMARTVIMSCEPYRTR